MFAPEACADHYVFWRFDPRPVIHSVTLKGQFQKEAVGRRVVVTDHLGNPARKIHPGHPEEDVHHPSVHLLMYGLDQFLPPPVPDTAGVQNQFTDGFEPWTLGQARFLLIPARKAPAGEPRPTTPPPPRVNHYLCYDVRQARRVVEPLVLRDQFGTTDTHELQPILFGIPVSKNKEPMIHPDVHLAIYQLVPGLVPTDPNIASTMDQLQPHHDLKCIESVFLGVPSFKKWTAG